MAGPPSKILFLAAKAAENDGFAGLHRQGPARQSARCRVRHSEDVKEWGTGTSRPTFLVLFPRVARSQSPFFHKHSGLGRASGATHGGPADRNLSAWPTSTTNCRKDSLSRSSGFA